jgi:hypothetical protein
MNISVSDLADRFSICKLKSERLDEETRKQLIPEITALTRELSPYYGVQEFVDKLYDVNGKIWDLEADIRAGKEGILGLEEVGRRAIMIRNLNKVRVGIKNDLVDRYKEGFKEIKINSASA